MVVQSKRSVNYSPNFKRIPKEELKVVFTTPGNGFEAYICVNSSLKSVRLEKWKFKEY